MVDSLKWKDRKCKKCCCNLNFFFKCTQFHLRYRFYEGCNQHLSVKQREISLPSILIIHCSRVPADKTYRKLKTRIEFPRFAKALPLNVIVHVTYLCYRSYQLTHPCSSANCVMN